MAFRRALLNGSPDRSGPAAGRLPRPRRGAAPGRDAQRPAVGAAAGPRGLPAGVGGYGHAGLDAAVGRRRAEHPPEVEETIGKLGWLPNAPARRQPDAPATPSVWSATGRPRWPSPAGVICQLAVHHGPADLRVAILTEPGHAADWDWAKWLPHVRSLDESSGRAPAGAEAERGRRHPRRAAAPRRPRAPALRADEAAGRARSPSSSSTPRASSEGRNSLARDILAGEGVPACGLVARAVRRPAAGRCAPASSSWPVARAPPATGSPAST